MGIIMQDFLNDVPLLEERMGMLLFYRDTRNEEPTDNGACLLDRCGYILDEVRKTHDVHLVMGSSQLPQRVRLFVDHILTSIER